MTTVAYRLEIDDELWFWFRCLECDSHWGYQEEPDVNPYCSGCQWDEYIAEEERRHGV